MIKDLLQNTEEKWCLLTENEKNIFLHPWLMIKCFNDAEGISYPKQSTVVWVASRTEYKRKP